MNLMQSHPWLSVIGIVSYFLIGTSTLLIWYRYDYFGFRAAEGPDKFGCVIAWPLLIFGLIYILCEYLMKEVWPAFWIWIGGPNLRKIPPSEKEVCLQYTAELINSAVKNAKLKGISNEEIDEIFREHLIREIIEN